MITDIEKHKGSNLGGVNSYRFCLADKVEPLPPVVNGAIQREIVFFPTNALIQHARWFDGYGTEGTMSFKDEQENGNDGAFYDKEFTAIIPKARPELVDLFNSLANCKFILDIKHNNGQRQLVGSPEEPLYLTVLVDTKSQVGDRNEHKVIFKGPGIERSPFYNV